MSMRRWLIAATVWAGLLAIPAGAAIVMTPYLQAVSQTSVCVMVECDATAPATVAYGTTDAYGMAATTDSTAATTSTAPPTYVHVVKLTGLLPATLYHYRASQGGDPTPDRTFTTAPAPGASFRFAIMGDCRTGTAPHDAIAARMLAANPRFSLYLGDLCGDSSYGMFKSEFFRPNELELISRVPFVNTVGNHEGWTTNTKTFQRMPASASGTQAYGSFDYGDIHVLVLNFMVPYAVGSPQYTFAAADLAAATKPWKVVIVHSPAYCVGGHGEDAGMITMATNVFEPNHVDLVLAGHSHFYQHNLVNGIPHLVLGGGGAPLHDPGTAPYVVKSAKSYSYAIVDFTPTKLHLVVYSDTGKELDTLDLARTPAPPVPGTQEGQRQ
jgi:acid phosphatase type 7